MTDWVLSLNLWLWEHWQTIADTTDAILGLPMMIAEILLNILQIIMYLPFCFIAKLILLLNVVIASLAGVINAVIASGNSIISLFTGVFDGVLPGPWVVLMGTIILLNVALRAYFFVKDISIAGFKI